MNKEPLSANNIALDRDGRVVLSDAELQRLCEDPSLGSAGGAGFNGLGCSNERNCGNTVNQQSCTNSAGACDGTYNANSCWNKEAGDSS